MKAELVIRALELLQNKERAIISQRFFKTGKGEYGEGDQFWGITVPDCRKVAKRYRDFDLSELTDLLRHPVHECRLVALLILVEKMKTVTGAGKDEEIVQYYLQNTRFVNNWDLVDLSADKILGPYLLQREKKILFQLAASSLLWERRMAIIATFHFIKQGEFATTLEISKALLNDHQDLIHKAVGWMLREVGKRDQPVEEAFLRQYSTKMPRTMLRYAIERFPEDTRQKYLKA